MRSAPIFAVTLLLTLGVSLAFGQRPPEATITPFVEAEEVRPGTSTRVALRVALPEGLHVQSDRPRDPSLIPTVLTVEPPQGVRVEQLVYPHPTDFAQQGQEQPLAVFEREFVLGAELAIGPDLPAGRSRDPGPAPLPGLRRQGLLPSHHRDDHVDRAGRDVGRFSRPPREGRLRQAVGRPADGGPPRDVPATPSRPRASADTRTVPPRLDDFAVLATTGGYRGRDDFLQFIKDAEQGVVQKGLFDGRGPLAILVIILLGGLLLNLTPCVLPMIPINLAIIGAGAQAGSRRRGFLLGSTYGAAMAVVYGALGLAVILTAGTFGTINASPWFNASHRHPVHGARAGDVRRGHDRFLALLERPAGAHPARNVRAWRSRWERSRRCSPARAWRRS